MIIIIIIIVLTNISYGFAKTESDRFVESRIANIDDPGCLCHGSDWVSAR